MSTQAIGGAAQTGTPAGELAAAARVRELQQMIERTRGVSDRHASPATRRRSGEQHRPATAFAAALQAAGAPTAGAASPLSSARAPTTR